MRRILLLLIAAALFSGCVGTKIFKGEPASTRVPDVVESFDAVDLDGNGTIDKEEYYANSVSINTDQPTTGLMWIILSVLVCAFGSAFVYRKR